MFCTEMFDGVSTGQLNEDVERKFQHVASSVHKMGMVLDSVQNDVMQLNRAMKEASLDCKLPIISTSIITVSITTETFVHEFCTQTTLLTTGASTN
jgi:nitrogen regulatory protein PII-like uncharacterized protein